MERTALESSLEEGLLGIGIRLGSREPINEFHGYQSPVEWTREEKDMRLLQAIAHATKRKDFHEEYFSDVLGDVGKKFLYVRRTDFSKGVALRYLVETAQDIEYFLTPEEIDTRIRAGSFNNEQLTIFFGDADRISFNEGVYGGKVRGGMVMVSKKPTKKEWSLCYGFLGRSERESERAHRVLTTAGFYNLDTKKKLDTKQLVEFIGNLRERF